MIVALPPTSLLVLLPPGGWGRSREEVEFGERGSQELGGRTVWDSCIRALCTSPTSLTAGCRGAPDPGNMSGMPSGVSTPKVLVRAGPLLGRHNGPWAPRFTLCTFPQLGNHEWVYSPKTWIQVESAQAISLMAGSAEVAGAFGVGFGRAHATPVPVRHAAAPLPAAERPVCPPS